MPRTPMIIRHPEDLDAVSMLPGFRTPGRGRIRLAESEGLEPGARDEFERRLNRQYFACGCDKAALGLSLGVFGYLAWIGFSNGFDGWGWGDLWLGLAVVVLATAAGKLIGRMSAERAFRRTAEELKRIWKAPPRPTGPIDACG